MEWAVKRGEGQEEENGHETRLLCSVEGFPFFVDVIPICIESELKEYPQGEVNRLINI